jgi:tol-pal system protein YbgF
MRDKAATEPLSTPEDLMRTAFADMSAGNWNLAISEFKEFLSKYPTHPRAAEAQLQIGEAYFNSKKFDMAVVEYDIVLQKYPKDDKTVTALYKEGLAYWELGQPEKAIAAMTRIQMEFPGSPESTYAKQKIAEWKPPAPARGRRG